MDFFEIGDYGTASIYDYGKNYIGRAGDDVVGSSSCEGCIVWGGGGNDVMYGKDMA